MNAEKALEIFERIENDRYSSNLFARANARYILFGVNEDRDNFPLALESNLDNGSDALAFSYLSIGCTLAEARIFDQHTKLSLEKGAELIEYTHLPTINRNNRSKYFLLIGALAYYASSQYSKAFILMKEATEYETDVSILISAFLKKDFGRVNDSLNKILLDQQTYLTRENSIIYNYHIIIFAKAISNLMDYLYTGSQVSLKTTSEILNDLEELLLLDKEPSLWWITRLFKIISNGLYKSSLWSTIPSLLQDEHTEIIRAFISNLIFGKKPIVELFTAQQAALPLIAANRGGVIGLPTSSGKTQIAVLAILKCLSENPDSKVLYIAPYRSLAFEVENSLKASFEVLGFEVSQLYGSGQFGKLDNMIIEEASILIATPEKAKVILRANETITSQIKLVIIDEGHLLDESQRNVKNELFVDELKIHVRKNNGITFLLSAVLPNSDDIANWIAEDPRCTVTEKERLARQRLGTLEFRKNTVSLEWFGEERSFNTNFIRPFLSKRKGGKTQPEDKAHAVGMTALRLSEQEKSVLIFTSRAVSVNTYAKAILKSMKLLYGDKGYHEWADQDAWEELNLLCSEHNFNKNADLLNYARYGILCHYGNIHKDIRGALERLMKNGNPRVIVATMTLGQGVNLGVSTVILADTDFYDREKKAWKPITHNEVWNIIGRAGRAFQDVEGKILFAIENKEQRIAAMDYINNPPKSVISGLLLKIKFVKKIAKECKIEFPELLELITSNDFSRFNRFRFTSTGKNVEDEFYEVFDWIDDTLLSLYMLSKENKQSIDDIIRSTLAYIQAPSVKGITSNEVLDFLKARNDAVEGMIPFTSNNRQLVLSSLPLASAIALDSNFHEILELGKGFIESEQTIDDKILLLKKIEQIIETFPSHTFKPKLNDKGDLEFPTALLDEARALWISGRNLSSGSNVAKFIKICNQYFGFTISWVVGAIANKCRTINQDDLAEIFEELALSCELGLPNGNVAKIYLAGVKSRVAAMDIFDSFTYDLYAEPNMNIRETRETIIEHMIELKKEATDVLTNRWLDFINADYRRNIKKSLPKFNNFILPKYPDLLAKRLYVKTIDNKTMFLSSPDYTEKFEIRSSTEWPFDFYANLMNYYFEYDGKVWRLVKQA